MMMSFANKTVLFVGGFGGIGFATCQCLLEHKIKALGVLDVHEDSEKLEQLRTREEEGVQVFFVKVDVADAESVGRAFGEAHQRAGRFDVVINGSGILNERDIVRTVQVNLLGVMNTTFAGLRYMDKSRGGSGGLIANIASVLGFEVYGAYAVYTATKHGVVGFTRSLADPIYYERSQVALVTICPGTTETPLLDAIRQNPVFTMDERLPLPPSMLQHQTAEDCGRRLVEALMRSKNGSMWVLRAGKLEEYRPSDHL